MTPLLRLTTFWSRVISALPKRLSVHLQRYKEARSPHTKAVGMIYERCILKEVSGSRIVVIVRDVSGLSDKSVLEFTKIVREDLMYIPVLEGGLARHSLVLSNPLVYFEGNDIHLHLANRPVGEKVIGLMVGTRRPPFLTKHLEAPSL